MIEFDFDDVIVDCQTIVEAGLLEKTGIDVHPQRSKNFYVTVPGYTNTEVGDLVREILFKDTHKMKPTKLAIESLEKISKLINGPIKIITARQKGLRKVTEKLMDSFVKGKFKCQFIFSLEYKKSAFLSPSTKFFVDDLPHHVNELAAKLDTVFIMKRPWNKGRPLKSNVIPINSLQDVVKFIENIL